MTNQSLLQNWLAQTALYRKQKFVVSSIMYDVGVGASLPTAPRLNVTRSPNAVVLSWPTYWVGHNLESSTGFEPPTSWRPVTPSPTLVGGSNIFTGTIGTEKEFFRLKY